jgi:hypothetical protein
MHHLQYAEQSEAPHLPVENVNNAGPAILIRERVPNAVAHLPVGGETDWVVICVVHVRSVSKGAARHV